METEQICETLESKGFERKEHLEAPPPPPEHEL